MSGCAWASKLPVAQWHEAEEQESFKTLCRTEENGESKNRMLALWLMLRGQTVTPVTELSVSEALQFSDR